MYAAEFCRRAERGLGVAIREGQANGTVETPDEGKLRGVLNRRMGSSSAAGAELEKLRPTDLATARELTGSRGAGIYAITDAVSDEQFETAVTEAKAEGNLTRANVTRKCKAQAAEPEPATRLSCRAVRPAAARCRRPAPRVPGGRRSR